MRRETKSFQLSEPLEDVRERLLGDWGTDLSRRGLAPYGHGEVGCSYAGEYRPWWIYVICVVFFPIGLLALLFGKNTESLQVELFDANGEGTRVEIVGKARRKIWRTVERWQSPSGLDPVGASLYSESVSQ